MKFVPGGPPRRSYQKRGLRKIIDCQGVAALLFDPGTGKTATALDFMSVLALVKPEREVRVLVTCPLAAVDTWVSQSMIYVADGINVWAEVLGGSLEERAEALAARGGQPFARPVNRNKKRRKRVPKTASRAQHVHRSWALQTRTERSTDIAEGPDTLGSAKPRLIIEVVNLDTFSSRRAVGSRTIADVMLNAVRRFEPDLVVVDESHKIKGFSSNVSRLMSRIGAMVPRRLILTGTVMPHSPLDVFAQWRFLDPYAFGRVLPNGERATATFGNFKDRYAVLGGWMGKQVVGFQNLDHLQDIMAQRAIVVRKQDALDLPQTTDVVLPVHLNSAESKAYEEMKSNLAAQISGNWITVSNRLAQMMRLRQITSGMLPSDSGVQVLGNSKVSVITSLVQDTLAGEKRIVIFCQFKAEIRALRQSLQDRHTLVEVIEGGVHGDERMKIRERFGSTDPRRIVLIAQIRTLSLAVNELVTASHAIFGSLSTQRDDIVQARDRLNRMGQERPVTYWYALAPGTVDEVIFDSIERRSDLEAAMLDHILGA